MKIQVKSIKISSSFSEETICFTGTLYINGVNCGIVKNDGRGGNTHIYRKNDLIQEADTYFKNSPKTKTGYGEFENSLESMIDDIVSVKLLLTSQKGRDMLNNYINTKLVLKNGEKVLNTNINMETNMLINNFMGFNTENSVSNFHTSYDALIPVLEKIHNDYYKQGNKYRDLMYTIRILLGGGYLFNGSINYLHLEFNITNLYNRVVEFIKHTK